MAPPLPPEMLDLIVDHLRDESTALKSCCLVSRSWIIRARRHLFARIEFRDSRTSTLESWMKTFPNPSNSPAHHTRSLSIFRLPTFSARGPNTRAWICAFRRLEHLNICAFFCASIRGPLLPFHGISPTLRSLSITSFAAPVPEVFDLVCSFPLLDDLELSSVIGYKPDTWTIPSTSPKLTGTLHVGKLSGTKSIIRRLLELPDGLHFSKILADCFCEAELTIDLVPRCFETLETLQIGRMYFGALPSTSTVHRYLTATHARRPFEPAASARSLKGDKAQRLGFLYI